MAKRVAIIGSGMAGLASAAWLVSEGFEPTVLEQNYLPGGCSSSYWRKGFVFESGATTLIGLDKGMPLHLLSEKTGIKFQAEKLMVPMKVHLPSGTVLTRHKSLEDWIQEVNRVFPAEGQEAFWRYCYKIAQTVWDTSTCQLAFPPQTLGDLFHCISNTNWAQMSSLPGMFKTIEELLNDFGLAGIPGFRAFIDEQLIISAQNHAGEVNVLFGATALCYTQFGNFYVKGGMIGLCNQLINYISLMGGKIDLRTPVTGINKKGRYFEITTNKGSYHPFDAVIGAIPVNNLQKVFPNALNKSHRKKILPSEKLSSCFQIGIGFIRGAEPKDCIHHQVITAKPLPQTGSNSFFVSYALPNDLSRADDPNHRVLSVTTHVFNPAKKQDLDKQALVDFILDEMEQRNLLSRSQIAYLHASDPADWQKWTQREWGFVGGYPQFKNLKPYQMLGSRLGIKGAYLAGDTAYPGQGIPGAALGGIIAANTLIRDLA